jgi:alginate O-acetyltransferase complex protein AlgI
LKSNRNNIDIVAKGKLLPSVKEFFQIILTFSLTCFAWIFFRADSVHNAISFIGNIFSRSLFRFPQLPKASLLIILLIVFFIIIEWLGREQNYAIERIFIKFPRPVRWVIYSGLLFLIGIYMQTTETGFIYFQF